LIALFEHHLIEKGGTRVSRGFGGKVSIGFDGFFY
jgi:hypothetical protein